MKAYLFYLPVLKELGLDQDKFVHIGAALNKGYKITPKAMLWYIEAQEKCFMWLAKKCADQK